MQTDIPPSKMLRYILMALVALTSCSMFGIALLVVLLWRSSHGAPASTATSVNTTGGTNTGSRESSAVAPSPPLPALVNPGAAPARLEIDEAARSVILADDRQRLSILVIQSAKRGDAAQYQANLFRLAVSEGRRNAIDVMSSQHSMPRETSRALAFELIDTLYMNGQFREITTLIARSQQMGLKPDDPAHILRGKLREPTFEPGNFSKLFQSLQCVDKRIIEEALEGSPIQREWAVSFLENGYMDGAPASHMIGKLNVHSGNLESLVVIMGKRNSMPPEFMTKHLALFDAEKLDRLLPQLKNVTMTDEIAKHLLSMPPATATNYFEQSDRFRMHLLPKWKVAQLKPTLPSDLPLEAFSPISPAIRRIAETFLDWDRYQELQKTPVEVLDWLWEHDFHFTQRSDPRVMMYLGTRHKSAKSIEDAVKQSRSGLECFEGFDLYATAADMAADKKTRFSPLEEILRQGDMDCLRAFCRQPHTPWDSLPGTHPVILALQSGRNDMAGYLFTNGAKLNETQMATVLAMPDVDLSFLDATAKSMPNVRNGVDWIGLERAVATGEMEKVEKALAEIQFQSLEDSVDARGNRTDWRSNPIVESVLTTSLGYPKIMSRLQFEGFPYTGHHVDLTIGTRNVPALKVLLRDMKLRDFICDNIDAIQNKLINDRLVCQAMIESGLLDELPTDAQNIIKREARLWGSKKQ